MSRTTILALLVSACQVSPMVYVDGVPNLDKVEDGVYRSGQITTRQGWDHIFKVADGRAIRVIKLNFENEGTDAPPPDMNVDVMLLPIQPEGDQDLWDDVKSTFRGPSQVSVNLAVDALRTCHLNSTVMMCLVHCTHGQDRTGYVVGQYRVSVDGWTKDKAYAEMRAHNFHWELHGIRDAWETWSP